MPKPSPTDFIGVIALLGGEIAEGSLKFCNAYPWRRIFLSFFVVPGLYKVGLALIKRTDINAGLFISTGIREDRKKVVAFKGSNKYKYMGMRSGTNAPVSNCLFEAWLNVNNKRNANDAQRYRNRENLGTATEVRYATINNNPNNQQKIYLTRDIWRPILAALLQSAAIIALFLMIFEFKGRWEIALVIILVNMWSYFTISFLIAIDGFYTASSNPAINAPDGNCVVTDMWGGNIWAINGSEKQIQDLLQKDICTEKVDDHRLLVSIYRKFRGHIEFIAGVFGCITTIATVLVTPLMSTKGKIFLAIQLLIGLLASMVYSSRDNDETLKQIVERYYGVDANRCIRYTNRAAAIAAATLFTRGKSSYIGESFLPRTEVYNGFRKILDDMQEETVLQSLQMGFNGLNREDISDRDLVDTFANCFEMCNSTQTLINNVFENFDGWPQRLLMDIVEAFIDVHITVHSTRSTSMDNQ
jgi:hypothetical protein